MNDDALFAKMESEVNIYNQASLKGQRHPSQIENAMRIAEIALTKFFLYAMQQREGQC